MWISSTEYTNHQTGGYTHLCVIETPLQWPSTANSLSKDGELSPYLPLKCGASWSGPGLLYKQWSQNRSRIKIMHLPNTLAKIFSQINIKGTVPQKSVRIFYLGW
jgi:hypothetical protein